MRPLEVVRVVLGQRNRAAVGQGAGEPEGRIAEPATHLEDSPGPEDQRQLVQETAHHRPHDGEAVPFVGVAPHLRLDRVGRAGDPRHVFVDERVDDVEVALHAGRR